MILASGFKKIAAASVLCSIGFAAHAVPLITEWNVDQEFEWTEFTQNTGTGSGVVGSNNSTSAIYGDNIEGFQTLQWSDTFGNTSSIEINNGNQQTVNTSVGTSTDGVLDFDVDFGLGPLITHNNQTLFNGASTLDTATATDFINLRADEPDLGNFLPPRTLTYDIDFFESPNGGTGASCPQGNPDGNSCRDVFTISGPGLIGNFVDVLNSEADALAIDSFLLPADGPEGGFFQYTIYLLAEGLGLLSDEVCAVAGAQPGCFGLVTDENASNNFQLHFAIAAQRIPEPAILMLMALGLIGFGIARRRQA